MATASPARSAVGVDADVLQAAAAAAVEYATSVDDRRVVRDPAALAALATFDEALLDPELDLVTAHDVLEDARHRLLHNISRLADILLHANPAGQPNAHARTAHHQPPAPAGAG